MTGRPPQAARPRHPLGAGALAAVVLAGTACAHGGLPAARHDTVWEGKIAVRGTVVIPAGQRLVIRPGTQVGFEFLDEDGDGAGDSAILVQGALEARGSAAAPIVFGPESGGAGTAPGWREVLLEDAARAEFAHCRFAGAQQAVHAHRTPLLIEASRFERNGIGVRFTGGPVTIRGNLFQANGTALRYWESSPEVVANEFQGNGTAVFVREGSARSVLARNNFLSSADYHIKLGESQAADVEARENWWGTDRREQIERLIFDQQDADYLGRVRYEPPAPGPF